jgi:hypothetical protein
LNKISKLFLLFAYLLFFPQNLSSSVYSYIYPYNSPSFSNYGTVGLIQNPSGRFHEEGTVAFSWSHIDPYLRGSIIAYPFDWLEASFQYTDINNELYSPYPDFSGSQSLKDKSFDAKIRLFKESNWIPNTAIGLRDLGGTGVFSAEYIVLNKYLTENLDFSLGMGWGLLNGNKLDNPLINLSERFREREIDIGLGGKFSLDTFFAGDAGLFGGFEYFFRNTKGLRLKVEYDGTNYEDEAYKVIPQDSKINFGFIYPINDDFQLKASYVRGNQINFGFSFKLSLGPHNPRKIIKEKQYPIENADLIKVVTSRSRENLYRASLKYLSDESFYLQTANINHGELEVVYSESKYRNVATSTGRVIRILDQIAPEEIESFNVAQLNGALGMYKARISRQHLHSNYLQGKNSELLESYLDLKPFNFQSENYEYIPKVTYPKLLSSLSPDLRSQIGGPDGFFFGDLKLTLNSELILNRNLSLITVASYGLYDNMDDLKLPSDSVLPRVRTEIVQYLKQSREFSIRRMQLNYWGKYKDSFYYKISGGILESMFNGFGFEMLYKPFYKDFGIGIEAWNVQQRGFDQLFETLDYKTITGHLTFYYQEPNSNILFKLKGGRYLAEDSGMTFDFSRTFRSGMRVGAFFSLTDISSEEFGEGSFDKGFYFWVPVDIFSKRYFKRTFGWGLRPITRDGAASLIHGFPLWGVTDYAHARNFERNIYDFYE